MKSPNECLKLECILSRDKWNGSICRDLLPIVLRDHKIEQMINEPIKLKKAKRKTSYSIYYNELYESRSTEVYIKTADELNIKYNKRGENVAKLEDDLEPKN